MNGNFAPIHPAMQHYPHSNTAILLGVPPCRDAVIMMVVVLVMVEDDRAASIHLSPFDLYVPNDYLQSRLHASAHL